MSITATMLHHSKWDFLPGREPGRPIRTGVIGCGPRAWENVIPKLFAYREYQLTCLCDIRSSLVSRTAEAVQDKWGCKLPTYTAYREMIDDVDLDAVIILIDPGNQASVICDALEAGLHVMAEVPLCYSIEDCWRIVTTVERTGKQFLLMEQVRYAGYVQAWRSIVASGVLGPIVLGEGEYFHNLPLHMHQDNDGVYYKDAASGNGAVRRTWRSVRPPIVYLPHDLSPILHVLDDRVVSVVGMESPALDQSSLAPMQIALMKTYKASVLRMATSFNTAAPSRHWQHVKGTRGYVEVPRHGIDCEDAPHLMWVDGWQLRKPIEMPWGLSRIDASAEASGSGHGDCDYYVFAVFADAVLREIPIEFDVYRAAEITAPAILAAESINRGGVLLEVPDFVPNEQRPAGTLPNAVPVPSF